MTEQHTLKGKAGSKKVGRGRTSAQALGRKTLDNGAPSRNTRRKIRTRTALVTAARQVMAEKGFEATTINNITETADVALGSFYNYFQSKEDILQAVAYDIMNALGDRVDAAIADIEDPAEAMVVACYSAVTFGMSQPDLGWFIIRASFVTDLWESTIEERLFRDLERGVNEGRFKIDDLDMATQAINGALIAVLAARLKGKLEDDAILSAIGMILRALGIPPRQIEKLINKARQVPGISKVK